MSQTRSPWATLACATVGLASHKKKGKVITYEELKEKNVKQEKLSLQPLILYSFLP